MLFNSQTPIIANFPCRHLRFFRQNRKCGGRKSWGHIRKPYFIFMISISLIVDSFFRLNDIATELTFLFVLSWIQSSSYTYLTAESTTLVIFSLLLISTFWSRDCYEMMKDHEFSRHLSLLVLRWQNWWNRAPWREVLLDCNRQWFSEATRMLPFVMLLTCNGSTLLSLKPHW